MPPYICLHQDSLMLTNRVRNESGAGGELPLHNFLRFVNTVFLFGHEWVINQTKAGLWGLIPFFSK